MRGISRHDEVLKYLKRYERNNKRMPTVKLACYELNIGNGSLHRVLNRLREQGYLRKIVNGINYEVVK